MKMYICNKEVKAEPMMKQDAQNEGLLRDEFDVDQPGYKVVYSGGYESWSPKKAFEDGYTLKGK